MRRVALVVLLALLPATAQAQSMVEVPTDAATMARLRPAPPPPLLPAPRADEPLPPPLRVAPALAATYRVEGKWEPRSEVQRRLVVLGGAILGGSWLATAIPGLATGNPRLAVPLAGPLLWQLDLRPHTGGESVMLVFVDTLAQAAGLAILIAGLVAHHKVMRRVSP